MKALRLFKKTSAYFSFFLLLLFKSYGQSDSAFKSKLSSIEREKNDTVRINSLFDLALQSKNRDLKEAKIYASRAYHESKSLDQKKIQLKFTADACNILGMIMVVSGLEDSASILFDESLSNNLLLNDPPAIAKSYNNLGNLNYYKGVYNVALSNYLNGLRISEKLKDLKGVARVADNIGNVYYKLNDPKSAIRYHQLSLEKHKLLGDSEGVASNYINIGLGFQKTGEYAKSLSLQKKALAIYTQSKNNLFIAKCYNNIALAYDEMDSIDLALEYYKKSLKINSDANFVSQIGLNQYNIGNIYLQKKDFVNAVKALEASKLIIYESSNLEILKNIYKKLAEANLAVGKHAIAYLNLAKYDSIQSIVMNEEVTSQIAEMQIKYETEKKDDQLKIQKLELETKEKEAVYSKILFIGIVTIILLLFSFFFIRFKSKQKLKDEIDRIEKENVKKRVELETKEKERNRISTELHDNVGSSVSFISSKIDWLIKNRSFNESEKVELLFLKDSSQDVMNRLRETLWTLNNKSISNTDLCDKLKVYLRKYILCTLNITDSLSTECILPNEDVLAIYRCAQEIANNINKHSEAQTVKIEFYSDENTKLKISFLDDGVGFEEENKEDSYGLRNIRNRLKDIGAKLEINSVKGRGTSVTIIYN